jgi:hypothetical protein
MRATVAWMLLTGVASIGVFRNGRAQEHTRCDSARVQYAPFDDSYSSRFQIKPSPGLDTQLSAKNKVFSTQHTRWLIEVSPDTMKPGPWTTRVYVGRTDSAPDVELRFVGETNGGVGARWLNEKLIFGEAWWGRIGATDFIFDVEQSKFVYREMAHFGELIQPCQ